jgi:PhzF family phenazine biosynthesis protein
MRPFRQVDVFTDEPLRGNPVAVVHDADGLTTADMLAFTRWTNLSEATFLLPPTSDEADYRVRIFTLVGELPFAGHPTLGTCHAWLEAGGRPRDAEVVVQECGAGLVPVRRSPSGLAFAAPPLLRGGAVEEDLIEEVAEVLGISRSDVVDAQWADNGPGWVAVRLASAEAVLALRPPTRPGPRATDIGVVGLHPEGSPCAYEVRAFFADADGALREDPVTGSLNASVAQWLVGAGVVEPPYVAAQGTALGRMGRVRIDRDGEGRIWVGGRTATVLRGTVTLPPSAPPA